MDENGSTPPQALFRFVLAVVVFGLVIGGVAVLWRTFPFREGPRPEDDSQTPESYIFTGSNRGKGANPQVRLFTMRLDTTGLTTIETPGRVESFDLSPSGQSLAFSMYTSESETWDIYVMNTDGTDVRNITNDEAVDGFPRWSADGRWIAYDTYVDHPPWDLWIINADGSRKRRLTESEDGFSSSSPAWSPDGAKLAFVRSSAPQIGLTVCGDGQPSGIFVVNADGSGVQRITSNGCDSYPTWSPDGTKMAFVRNQDLHVMNSDGSEARMLSECVPCENVGVADQSPVWSPDGREISFIRLSQIYVVNADGTDVRKIPRHGAPPPIYVDALDRGPIPTTAAVPAKAVREGETLLHTDPGHGWTLRVPKPLQVKPYRIDDLGHREGTLVANYPLDAVPPNAVASLPPDGSLFKFEHAWSGEGPVHELGNESSFPLSLDDFAEIAAHDPAGIAKALQRQILANGSVFQATLLIGSEAPTEDVERLRLTVESLTFPPLMEGTATGDDFYVLDRADAYEVGSAKRFTGFSGDYPTGIDFFFLVRAPGGFYGVQAAAPKTQVLLSLDRDRFEFGWEAGGTRWNRLGEVVHQASHGPAEKNLKLYLARVAHDGHVIVRFLDPIEPSALRGMWA